MLPRWNPRRDSNAATDGHNAKSKSHSRSPARTVTRPTTRMRAARYCCAEKRLRHTMAPMIMTGMTLLDLNMTWVA